MDAPEKSHATTISHTSTTCGYTTTTTTTITTTITTKHRHNTNNRTDHSSKLTQAIDLYIHNRYQDAKQIIENLLQRPNKATFDIHFHYACVCNKLQSYDLATKHLNIALSMNSNHNAYKHMLSYLIECNPTHDYYRFHQGEETAHAIQTTNGERDNTSDYDGLLHHFDRDIDPYSTSLISALLLYELEQSTRSEEYFKKCLTLKPQSDEAYGYYAMFLMDIQHYNTAEKTFKKAISLCKNKNGRWHFKYAQLSHKLKRYKQCEVYHKEALKLEPNNARYNDQYGAYLMRLGRFKESSLYFKIAHQTQIEKKEYRIMYDFTSSMSNIKSERDVERNFKSLQKQCGTLSEDMLRIKKEFERNMIANDKKYQMVKKYYNRKEYDKCKDILDELIGSNPNHFDYHFLNAKVLESAPGSSKYTLRNIQYTVKSYKCALALNPTHGGCHYSFGKLLIKIKKFRHALMHFKAAISSNPNHCAYNMMYAILLMYDPMNGSDKELFDDEYDDESDDDDDEYMNPIIDYNESQTYFEKCLSLHPKNAECNYKYGLLLIKMNKNTQALTYIRKANKLKNEKEKRYKLKYNKLKNVCEKEKKLRASGDYVQKVVIHKQKKTHDDTCTRKRKYDDIVIDSEDDDSVVDDNVHKNIHKETPTETKTDKHHNNPAITHKHTKKDKKTLIAEKQRKFGEYIRMRQYKKARGVMKELVGLDSTNSKYANEYGLLLKRDKKKISESEKYFSIAMKLECDNIIYKSNYGCLLFDNERYKESESYLKYCVVHEPRNAFYNHMYALLLQRQHKFHESFEYHQKAIQLDYHNDRYKATYNKLIAWYDQFPRQEKERMKRMYLEAESYAKHMEFSIAEPTFKKLVEKNPYNLVYVFRYAYVLQRLKKYTLAEKYYKMCLNIEGDHNICHGDYALLLSKQKRYKEADAHYKKCLYTDPENWICRKNYAVSLEIRQRYKEAAKYFREALTINPNDRETNQRYQKLLDRIPKLKNMAIRERERDRAKEKAKVSINTHTHTQSPASMKTTAVSVTSGKKSRRRGRKKRKVSYASINEEEQFNKAMQCIQHNDIKSAQSILGQLVSVQRSNAQYVLEYARCLNSNKLLNEAIREYKHVLQINGAMHGALYELGNLYENEIGDLRLAADCYRRAFELQCTNDLYRESCQNCVKNLQLLEFGRNFSSEQRKRMSMTFENANEYIKCKNYNEAKKLLEEILRINPDYFLYNAKYALVLHRLKMYKLAETYFKKAIAIDPTNSISRGVYGGMLFQLKRYDEAEDELKVCLAINPNNWICHQDYARLLEYKNDLKNAAYHSKKAFEINPSDHESYQRYQYLLKKIDKGKDRTKEKEKDDNTSVRSHSHSQDDHVHNKCNIQMIEPMDDRSQQSRHHTRHSIASTQSPQSGFHSPRSNYSSNNFALSPTRTLISVSSKPNNQTMKPVPVPMSLSSMYSYDHNGYDELQTMYTPPPEVNENGNSNENESKVINITPPSTKSSMFNYSNNASISSLPANNALFQWNEFDRCKQYMKTSKFIMAEPILHDLVISLTQINLNQGHKHNENIPYFDCIHHYAQCLYELRKFEDALKYFKMALIYNSNDADCNYKLALLLKELRKYTESRIYFEKCTRLSPYAAQYFYEFGLLLELIGDEERYIQFEKAYHLKPHGLKFKKKFDEIHAVMEKAKAKKNNDHKYIYSEEEAEEVEATEQDETIQLEMARKYVECSDWSNAASIYRTLVDEETSQYHDSFECLYEYARVLCELRMFGASVEYYERGISVNNSDSECFYEYGRVLHHELNNISKAQHQYEKCLSLTNHAHYKCLFDYTLVLRRKRKTKEALKCIKKCLECVSTHSTISVQELAIYHNEHGLLLRSDCKYDLANISFQKAMSFAPNRLDILANYAYCLFLNERYKEAEVVIGRCLEGDCDNAFVNHVYALLLRRTNRFAEAFQYHHKAIELNPNNRDFKQRYDEFLEYSNRFSHDEKQKMKRKFDRAQMMIKSKHFDKARALLASLSAVNPYNIVYVFKYAFVLHRLKQYKEAEKYYQMALGVEGDHSICHFDYGLMLSKLRRLDEAQYHYKRCLHMNPSDWICHINYARLLEKFGNFKDAAFHLEKALEINPNDAEAHQCYSQVVKKLKQQKHWTKKEETKKEEKETKKEETKKEEHKSPWRRVAAPSAKKLADTMCEQQNEMKVTFANAKQLYDGAQYEKSEEIYRKLIEISQTSDKAIYDYYLGYAQLLYFGLKQYNDAVEYYRNAIGLKPDDDVDASVHYELSNVLLDLNRWTESGDAIVCALRLDTDNIEYNYQYALILEECNNYGDAITYYRKCGELELDYKDVRSKIDNYAYYVDEEISKFITQKDYGSAKKLLYPLIADICDDSDTEIEATSFEYLLKYAQVQLKLNEFNESEEYYKMALKLKPDEPNCYYNLGIICEQRHRNAEATMYLEKAAALQPHNDVFRNKYNDSVLKLQQQQSEYIFGSLFHDDDIHNKNIEPIPPPIPPPTSDDINIQNELHYNSYLFAPSSSLTYSHHHHHHIHHHHHHIDDDIFSAISHDESLQEEGNESLQSLESQEEGNDETATAQSSINEEKTVEETQHQSYCHKQRQIEFRWFLQEKVGFNTKHFEQYFRRFVNEGLADIRLLPYFDELTLTNMEMSQPHQKLLLNKIHHFTSEMDTFSCIFGESNGIPYKYFNTFADYGICTIQSFCKNFKNKSDLIYILDNNVQTIDQLWNEIIKIKNEQNSV